MKTTNSTNSTNSFNRFCFVTLLAALTSLTTGLAQSAAPPAASGQDLNPAGKELTWPREFLDNGTKVAIYQPQIEKWDGADFETRAAAALTPAISTRMLPKRL